MEIKYFLFSSHFLNSHTYLQVIFALETTWYFGSTKKKKTQNYQGCRVPALDAKILEGPCRTDCWKPLFF
jgi:hypothetical protein